MHDRSRVLTGVERTFGEDEVIVSKTDRQGRLTYANKVFERVSGYSQAELIGKPHSLIRHPEMPRCVFQLLWDTIQAGREIFAYVVNTAKNGDHYWVLAHVTPTFNGSGEIIGFHSNRRKPDAASVAKVKVMYRELSVEEARHAGSDAGMAAGKRMLVQMLEDAGMPYEEFVFSLVPIGA